MMAHALPDARLDEVTKVAVHRPPRRERRRRRQVTPLASGPHHVEQTIEHTPHVRRAWPTARFRWRDQRDEQAVVIIAQGLPAAKVANHGAVFRGPHRRLPESSFTSCNSSPAPPSQPLKPSNITFQTGSKLDFAHSIIGRVLWFQWFMWLSEAYADISV